MLEAIGNILISIRQVRNGVAGSKIAVNVDSFTHISRMDHDYHIIYKSFMNFNRIQKYRSERTIAQLNSVRNNRHVTAAEAATEVGDSRPLDLVLAGKNGNKI